MIAGRLHTLEHSELKDFAPLSKDTWIVILHASRIPSHVGLLINGVYNSLTIKGPELDIAREALLKTVSRTRMQALFIRIVKHPVFSADHQLAMFREQLLQFSAVEPGGATCLSPLKRFFEEFYAIRYDDTTLLFDFVEVLKENGFIDSTRSVNIPDKVFSFRTYTAAELDRRISEERAGLRP